MYAIVEIAGQQFRVENSAEIFVNRLEGKEGSKVSFDKVLLVEDGGKISVGTPTVSGSKVEAKIIEHLKGDKVIVFKKKRRKGYKVKNGFRPYLTKIQIESINGKAAEKKAAAAKPKAAAKKEETAEAKPAATAKTAETKTTATKAAATKPAQPKAEKKEATTKPKAAAKPAAKKPVSKTGAPKAGKAAPKKDDKE